MGERVGPEPDDTGKEGPSQEEFRRAYEEGLGIDPVPRHEQEKIEQESRERGWVPEKHIWVRQNWDSGSLDTDYRVDVRTEGQQIPEADELRPDELLLAPGESVGVKAGALLMEGKDRVLINKEGKPKFARPKKTAPTRGWLERPYQDYGEKGKKVGS